ncbi:hypothetical protein FOQG_16798 [Fusarium oxysporum f. sp. raphani 54005]|uniref:Uncharacterized protein n=3 Tax=Fusarium oxysporum TaxID=5507 RepID=X0BJ83_FUSOX|nr:hypothetical protein FOVG_08049 [Fusarium oxysporum f. sp. pisi HDV247]EXK78529.1 hypothetical protein FOQG_16798 [Fusarium oxysporum f. sp. raphani 54005]EXL77874.1 hypothetical protein FOPG_07784 [Fusarium oxysporum f. sp. conglutinans race 2 54008]KAI8413227.1 hypothetical protein FOFC_06502 [Fusarium oxysporum]
MGTLFLMREAQWRKPVASASSNIDDIHHLHSDSFSRFSSYLTRLHNDAMSAILALTPQQGFITIEGLQPPTTH